MTEPVGQVRSVRRGETIFAVIVMLACAAAFAFTPQLITNYRHDTPFQLSPGFFPRLALAVALVGAVWQILHLRHAEPRTDEVDEFEVGDSRPVLVAGGIALFVAYFLAAPWLGYAASTFLFVLVASLISGVPRRVSVILAAAISACLYGLFAVALKVWFPKPALLILLGLA